MVQQQVEEFVAWNRARELGPLIEQLFAKITRHGAGGGAADAQQAARNQRRRAAQHLEELARRIVNKLLNDPVQAVRESGTESSPFIRAMAKLFRLGA